LWLAGVPGELFAELGLEVKRRVDPARTFLIGLNNDMLAYLPPVEAFYEGGYHVAPDIGMVDRLAGERVKDAIYQTVEALRRVEA
jgi:hypothetical protein